MKLISLKLDSFRQHSDSTIEFGSGLTGVVGANGAGKTSIVEAITFALYGSRALRGKIEDVRTRGKSGGRDFLASLIFEHDGVVYRVERNRDGAEIYCGGEAKPQAKGSREVTAQIESILGMNFDEFATTFFTEQKGLEFLSGMKGGAERERFIVRVMGYHKLELAQEKIRSDKRDLKSEIAGLEQGLPDRTVLEAKLVTEKLELENARQELGQADKALTSAESQATSAKRELDRMVSLAADFERLEKEIHTRQVRLEEKEKRLAVLTEGDSQGGPSNKELLEAEVHDLQKAVDDIDNNVAKNRIVLQELEQAWRDERTVVGSRAFALKEQLALLENRRLQFTGLAGQEACPTCGQELGASLENVQSTIEKQIAQTNNDLNGLLAEEKQLASAPTQVASLAAEIAGLEKQMERLAKNLGSAKSALTKFEQGHALRLEKEQLKNEHVALTNELNDLTSSQASLNFSANDWSRVKVAYEAAAKLVDVSRLQKVRCEGQLQTKQALVDRTINELGSLDSKKNKLSNGINRVSMLEQADRMLTDFRKFVNGEIRPRLAELSSILLADLTDGRYSTVEIAPDFTPTVCDEFGPKPVISGGEQDILNLCVRLSLSQMLAERAGHSLSLLILDEVFGSLDDNRRMNVLSLFEKLGNRFEQVIVISHLDDVKEGVQNIINVDYDEVSAASYVGSESQEVNTGIAANI